MDDNTCPFTSVVMVMITAVPAVLPRLRQLGGAHQPKCAAWMASCCGAPGQDPTGRGTGQ